MLKPISYLMVGAVALLGTVSATTPAQAEPPPHDHATFGECVSTMARSGPNHHAAMMGADNFGQVVLHCQTMHDPPAAG